MSYLMMDLLSTEMNAQEQAQLMHPMVGGLILFSRNYQDRHQLCTLVASVRALRPDLLIAVDHEGGRVQRFIEGFSKIPAMGDILPAAKHDLQLAKRWATELGFLMAVELLSCDIDLSFAPVLDLNGISQVIGTRAFSDKPDEVIALAGAFIQGMQDAGMAAVGKHFPGHGSVAADSHIAKPVDERSEAEIRALDMVPFQHLMGAKQLQGVMPAHVIYPKVDPNPAGFSSYWLKQVLREELKFDGVIFSDDLGMKGAGIVGGYSARARAAIDAGCDMILLCNDSQGVSELLTSFQWPEQGPQVPARKLLANGAQAAKALEDESRYLAARRIAEQICMG
ncbi:beta-N-acetylhexosaminidase [Shewanella insulae]|uniref:beta-N-acetylhexosaminidase n=1 Tax=Shewanella insulae TaxID=2681496 RepID=UPI001EFC7D83|nr:beta-N-acetylhexosaminidase [Shewanella insulae]MCG9711712.1 beta-N-acetylhexosaminidase [Shewanella insulae]MCG9756012.1 beta-N-acetylhexosaminidase [Shewanella insulae]